MSNPMTDHPTRPDLDKWEALASEADYTGYTMFLPTPAEMRQMVAYVRHLQSERDAAYRRGVEAAIATLLEKSTWLREFGHADDAPPIERCAGWIAVLLPPDAGAVEGQ